MKPTFPPASLCVFNLGVSNVLLKVLVESVDGKQYETQIGEGEFTVLLEHWLRTSTCFIISAEMELRYEYHMVVR